MTKRLVIAATLLAAIIGGFAYYRMVFIPQMIRQAILSKGGPPTATVTSEVSRKERWTPQLKSIGTLVSVEGVDIASQVPGVVTEVLFDSGTDVAKGAKLVQLDTAIEEADLASARATLREAELAFERQSDLIRRKVTSEANVDTAQARRDTAAAAVKRIEAVIAQKSIVAPFAGRIGIRKVEKGQFVSPGAALTSLQALDPIRVDFPVPEQSIALLKVGQRITLAVDTFPGKTFAGEIQSLDARVVQETRTLLVRGQLTNPDKMLLPGMFANVTVEAGADRDVVTVPRTAVTYSLYGDSVYVVQAAPQAGAAVAATPEKASGAPAGARDSTAQLFVAERRFVKVGEAREDRVAVLSGLSAGEQVVTTGQLKINPGVRLKIDNTQAPVRAGARPKQ